VLLLFIELDASREGHGRPSSRISRKIRGYDEFSRRWLDHEVLGTLPCFPAVLLITHGEQRLQNLVQAVAKQRRQPVAYALALATELLTAEKDVLTAPCWRLLPAGTKTLTGPIEVEPQALLGHSSWLKSLHLNGRPVVRPIPQPVAGRTELAPPTTPASKAAPAKSTGTGRPMSIVGPAEVVTLADLFSL
jgi:hypothetical protein